MHIVLYHFLFVVVLLKGEQRLLEKREIQQISTPTRIHAVTSRYCFTHFQKQKSSRLLILSISSTLFCTTSMWNFLVTRFTRSLPLILNWVAASISHFLITAIKSSCFSSNEIRLLCSSALFLFFLFNSPKRAGTWNAKFHPDSQEGVDIRPDDFVRTKFSYPWRSALGTSGARQLRYNVTLFPNIGFALGLMFKLNRSFPELGGLAFSPYFNEQLY